MQKRKLQLLKFILFLLIKNGICSISVVESAWKPISINGSIFDDPSYQNEKKIADSEIKCALIANKLRWPNVLYFNGGLCHLATVDLTSRLNVSIEGSMTVEGKWMHTGNTTAIQPYG